MKHAHFDSTRAAKRSTVAVATALIFLVATEEADAAEIDPVTFAAFARLGTSREVLERQFGAPTNELCKHAAAVTVCRLYWQPAMSSYRYRATVVGGYVVSNAICRRSSLFAQNDQCGSM